MLAGQISGGYSEWLLPNGLGELHTVTVSIHLRSHYNFKFQGKQWYKAVWIGEEELEDTIPLVRVDNKRKEVIWPKSDKGVSKMIADHAVPTPEWRTFKLKKIEITDGESCFF